MPIITGTDSGEQVVGTAGDDEIDALGGDDHISGRGGDDEVDGGSGNDTVYFGSSGQAVTVTSSGGRIVIDEAGVQSVSAINVESFAIVAGGLATAGLTVDASTVDVPISFTLHDYYANTIVGSTGNNVFARTVGLAGFSHTLTGGGGVDRYEFYTDLNSMAGVTILDFDIDDTIHVLPMIAASYVGSAPLAGAGDYRSYTAGGQTFVVADGGTTVLTIANGQFALEETAPGSNVLRIAGLVLTEGDDDFDGGAGNETVFALGGDDTLDGAGGDDVLDGGAGDDTLDGAEGDDRLVANGGHDTVDGGGGADVLVIDWSEFDTEVAGDLTMTGAGGSAGFYDAGPDRSLTFSGIESVDFTLGAGTNRFHVAGGIVRGGEGSDHIDAVGGALTFYGGGGHDIFMSGSAADFYDGGASGHDTIAFGYAGSGITASLGAQPGDTGSASDGDTFVNVERLYGSTYNDTLHGSEAGDVLAGDQGDDTIHGNGGNDTIDGGAGDDWLNGGDGHDIVYSGSGADAVYGEDGYDRFIIAEASDGDAYDGGADADELFVELPSIVPPSGTAIYDLTSTELVSIERIGFDSNNYGDIHVVLGFDQLLEAGIEVLTGGGARDTLTLMVTAAAGASVTATMPEFTLNGLEWSSTPYIASSIVDTIALAGTMPSAGLAANYTLIARDGIALQGSLQTLIGASGDDTLIGSSHRDYLSAFGGGADLLQGGANADVLVAANTNYLGTVSSHTWAGSTFDGGADGVDTFSVGGVVNFAGTLTEIEHIYLQPEVITAEPGGHGSQAAAHLTIGAAQLAGLTPSLALSGTGTLTVNLAPGDTYDASGFAVAGDAAIAHLVNGSTAGDTISGLVTDDTINGGDGDDRLDGTSGHDTVDGGAGSDVLVVDWSDSTDAVIEDPDSTLPSGGSAGLVTAGSGRSVAFTGIESVDVTTGSGNDELYLIGGIVRTGGGDDQISAIGGPLEMHGGDGDDTLNGGDGNDRLDGGNGHDTIDGGAGDDLLVVDWGDATEAVLGDLDETWPSGGTTGSLTSGSGRSVSFTGIESVDVTTGSGDDQLYLVGGIVRSGGGNDYVWGIGGALEFHGGDGDDQFLSSDAADVIDGGAGSDRVEYTLANAGVTVSLGLLAGDTGTASDGDQIVNVESLVGSAFADSLAGSNGANFLAGYDGNDAIDGRGGNDELEGGAGDDMLTGGTGDDLFHLRDAGDLLFEAAGEGNDRAYVYTSYVLAAGQHVERLTAVEYIPSIPAAFNITGNELANRLEGNSRANVLSGGDGNDVLDGKAGADTLIGGGGDDWFYVDSAGDTVSEAAGNGNDRVFANLNYTLGAGQHVETLGTTDSAGTAAISLTGNEFANTILGNAGNNTLNGGAGADTLYGYGGNDFYYVDNAGDVVVEGSGAGTDRVFASASFVLGAGTHVEMLTTTDISASTAINLTGNELANAIVGNAGSNTLNGGGGADSLNGQGGDDWYYVDSNVDVVIETTGNGTDRVFASTSYTLLAGAHVETLSTTNNAGTEAINLTGSDFANTILGNAGNNVLNGGGGADTMYGNAGDDWFHADNASDVAVEGAGMGNDRVFASVTYTLTAGSHVETLSTSSNSGTADINLTGNAFANTILGNAGANTLDGGGGADTLYGYGGDDWYYVDDASDAVFESTGAGTDRVLASTSYALGAGTHVETLTFANTSAATPLNLTGNELANTLIGNNGDNRLDGGAGADTLVGGGGNDWYYVDSTGDAVIEGAGQGFDDRIYTSVSLTLGAGVDVERMFVNFVASGTAIDLTGNELVNALTGHAGRNTLNGGIGGDVMRGLGGDDVYFVDDAGDRVYEEGGTGTGNDRVFTSVSYSLMTSNNPHSSDPSSYVETLSTTDSAGTLAIDLTGNAVANTLLGNAGNNRLNGGGGADALYGYGGDDWFTVDDAGDAVFEGAGSGTDRVFASVSYALGAGAHVETLSTTDTGLTTAIDLTGNALANSLVGNAGSNVLDGGLGADTLNGYGGADTFRFTTALGGGNVDAVQGYNPADDTIQLDDAVFAGLALGALAAGAVNVGTAATQADDRIIYNFATGALLFDADGVGGVAGIQFATVSPGLAMGANEFFVI